MKLTELTEVTLNESISPQEAWELVNSLADELKHKIYFGTSYGGTLQFDQAAVMDSVLQVVGKLSMAPTGEINKAQSHQGLTIEHKLSSLRNNLELLNSHLSTVNAIKREAKIAGWIPNQSAADTLSKIGSLEDECTVLSQHLDATCRVVDWTISVASWLHEGNFEAHEKAFIRATFKKLGILK